MNWLGRVRQRIDAFDLLSLSLIVLLTGLALTYWHKSRSIWTRTTTWG